MQWTSSHQHQADMTGLNPTFAEHKTQARRAFFCFVLLCVKNLLKSIYDNTKEQSDFCFVTEGVVPQKLRPIKTYAAAVSHFVLLQMHDFPLSLFW